MKKMIVALSLLLSATSVYAANDCFKKIKDPSLLSTIIVGLKDKSNIKEDLPDLLQAITTGYYTYSTPQGEKKAGGFFKAKVSYAMNYGDSYNLFIQIDSSKYLTDAIYKNEFDKFVSVYLVHLKSFKYLDCDAYFEIEK